MVYQSLKIWGYQHRGELVTTEYQRRFNAPETLQTGLMMNPIWHGERYSKSVELFLVNYDVIRNNATQIATNSQLIEQLISQLPSIIVDHFFEQTLQIEILCTNELESVSVTTDEVANAVRHVNRQQPIRLQSFARMYFKIKQQEPLVIHELTDIRAIYDELLHGEIADDNLPNGQLFRNTAVRIGSSTKTVHLPKATEVEFLPDLMKWIEFINRDVPFLLKAFIAHYYFEYIHPFFDGNGRLGRYITSAYLGYKLDPFTAIIFSKEINNQRKRYYDAFVGVEEPKNYGEVTFFVKTMMEILLDGQQALIEELETKQS